MPPAEAASAPPALSAPPQWLSPRPLVGILGVLLGALISTLYGRITTFGLADVRGAIGAGVDEGAWITTAQSVGQMLVAPATVWAGAVWGVRRVLLVAVPVFAAASLLLPLSGSLAGVLAWQFVAGLSSGVFVPLTLAFVVQSLPPRLVPYGIAAYAMNSELSQNIGASLEGWFIDHWSWRWIFWENALIAVPMLACVLWGMPKSPVNRPALGGADVPGMVYAGAGFALIYAALDQGNRLDWLNSGLVTGLLVAGAGALVLFVIHERLTPKPWINLGFAAGGNIPLIALGLVLFRFALLSTAYIIPQYLGTVQGYRALETGSVLLFIAAPQILAAPLSGWLVQRIDPRIGMAIGFSLIAFASLLVARGLTRAWVTDDFLPSQLIQAAGQTFAMTSLVAFALRHMRPADALTLGAVLQTARLLGGELGSGLMQTYVRVREQVQSNLLGIHVQAGDVLTDQRLTGYAAAVAGRSTGDAAHARATGLLSGAVRTQAEVLSYIDGYHLVVLAIGLCLVLILLMRPSPASARS